MLHHGGAHSLSKERVSWLAGIISAADREEYCWQNIKEEDDFLPPDLSLETRCTPNKNPTQQPAVFPHLLNAFRCVSSAACAHPTVSAPSVYPHPLFYLLFCIIHNGKRCSSQTTPWNSAGASFASHHHFCVVHVWYGDKEWTRNFLYGAKNVLGWWFHFHLLCRIYELFVNKQEVGWSRL